MHFTYLFFYQTTLGVLQWLSQAKISLLNEQASKNLTRIVKATKKLNWVLWNAARCAIIHPQASKHDCLVNYTELSREKKHRILKRTPSGSFFSKGKLVAQVICVTAHTKSVRFRFLFESGSTIWGLSSFFSLAMFSTADGSCDSRSKVWFITEDVSITDQTRRGVGTPLFGLAGYMLLNRVCQFSRPWVSSS